MFVFTAAEMLCAKGADRMTPHMEDAMATVIGVLALGFAVLAVIRGSLTPRSLLVIAMAVLWALTTVPHARHSPAEPMAT